MATSVRWPDRAAETVRSAGRPASLITLLEQLRLYPQWQFAPGGHLVPGLSDVLESLLPAADAWTVAIWLTTPTQTLDDHGGDPDEGVARVLFVARAETARWSL